MQTIGQAHRRHAGGIERPVRQVQNQEIDRSILQEHRGHCQCLRERIGRDHNQPFELDAPCDRLDRVEASSQIEIRSYPTRCLGLSDCPQRNSRLAAGFAAAK